jgi:hypothetical protein
MFFGSADIDDSNLDGEGVRLRNAGEESQSNLLFKFAFKNLALVRL